MASTGSLQIGQLKEWRLNDATIDHTSWTAGTT
jgi:hypothetical protein